MTQTNKNESIIPYGRYCKTIVFDYENPNWKKAGLNYCVCPYWYSKELLDGSTIGYCSFLECDSRDIDEVNLSIKEKACGVNLEEDEDETDWKNI